MNECAVSLHSQRSAGAATRYLSSRQQPHVRVRLIFVQTACCSPVRAGPTMLALALAPVRFLWAVYEKGDPRTKNYPLVLNPLFVFPFLAGYLYFVKVAGPRWMANREPYRIMNLIRFHNAFMVVVSAWFLYLLLKFTYLPGGRYSLWCQGITGYMDEEMARYYKYGWFFIAARYADHLDTVFFVLRKKFTHITHLHVIHHTIVTINIWYWALYAPEGQPAFGLGLNVFVHIIMYTYYLLATMGPAVRKYLWWKKYLTRLQIAQFVMSITHMSIPLFVDCGFPRHLIAIANVQTFLILCLFINFYVKAYVIRKDNGSGSVHVRFTTNGCDGLRKEQ